LNLVPPRVGGLWLSYLDGAVSRKDFKLIRKFRFKLILTSN